MAFLVGCGTEPQPSPLLIRENLINEAALAGQGFDQFCEVKNEGQIRELHSLRYCQINQKLRMNWKSSVDQQRLELTWESPGEPFENIPGTLQIFTQSEEISFLDVELRIDEETLIEPDLREQRKSQWTFYNLQSHQWLFEFSGEEFAEEKIAAQMSLCFTSIGYAISCPLTREGD